MDWAFVFTLFLAAAAMALNDAIATVLTISEARGYALRSGIIAGFQDNANIFKNITGTLTVAAYGWSWRSVLVMIVIAITSGVTAYFSVKETNRWGRPRNP